MGKWGTKEGIRRRGWRRGWSGRGWRRGESVACLQVLQEESWGGGMEGERRWRMEEGERRWGDGGRRRWGGDGEEEVERRRREGGGETEGRGWR